MSIKVMTPDGERTIKTIDDAISIYGAIDETAPATDTASSGLNGRLQRVAILLSALGAKVATLGRKSMAGSSSIVLAGDHDAIAISSDALGVKADTAATSTDGAFSLISLFKRALGNDEIAKTAITATTNEQASFKVWRDAVKPTFEASLAKLADVRLGASSATIGGVNLLLGGSPNSDTYPVVIRAVPRTPYTMAYPAGIAIAAGGVVQIPANANRKTLEVGNATIGRIMLNPKGTANTSTGIPVTGDGYDFADGRVPTTDIVSVWAETAGTITYAEGV